MCDPFRVGWMDGGGIRGRRPPLAYLPTAIFVQPFRLTPRKEHCYSNIGTGSERVETFAVNVEGEMG